MHFAYQVLFSFLSFVCPIFPFIIIFFLPVVVVVWLSLSEEAKHGKKNKTGKQKNIEVVIPLHIIASFIYALHIFPSTFPTRTHLQYADITLAKNRAERGML